MPDPSPPRASRGSLLVIFLTVFIDLLGFGMVLPLLPIYGEAFAAEYQLSPAATGWLIGGLMASFSAMQFLFVPVWGRASDRWGRRPVILLGLAGSVVCYALFGVAAAMHSLAGLFATRIGAGIAGATIATAQAYIADCTTRETRAKGMALIGAAFALGFTLGPMLGGAALLAGGRAEASPWPGYAAAGLSAVALILAVFLLPESLQEGSRTSAGHVFDPAALRAAVASPSIAILLATGFLAVFSFANFESTLSLQVKELAHAAATGEDAAPGLLGWLVERIRGWGYTEAEDIQLFVVLVVFAYLGVTLTLAQGFLVRRLAGKLSEGTLATAGAVTAIVGFLLLAWAALRGDFLLLMLAMAVEVTGFAFVNPSLQSLLSRRTRPDEQGGILGLGQSASSLARVLGPAFGPRLLFLAPAVPYWVAAGLMVVAVFLIAVAARTGRDYA